MSYGRKEIESLKAAGEDALRCRKEAGKETGMIKLLRLLAAWHTAQSRSAVQSWRLGAVYGSFQLERAFWRETETGLEARAQELQERITDKKRHLRRLMILGSNQLLRIQKTCSGRAIVSWACACVRARSAAKYDRILQESSQESALMNHRVTEVRFENDRLASELTHTRSANEKRLVGCETAMASLQVDLVESRRQEKSLADELHQARMLLVKQGEEYDQAVSRLESEARDARHEASEATRAAAKAEELSASFKERLNRKSTLETEMSVIIAQHEEDVRRAKHHEEEQLELERELRDITTMFGGLRKERDEAKAAAEHYRSQVAQITTELHTAQTDAAVAGARLRESQRFSDYGGSVALSPSLPPPRVLPSGGY